VRDVLQPRLILIELGVCCPPFDHALTCQHIDGLPRDTEMPRQWFGAPRRDQVTVNVRFGSKADICSAVGNVRFAPESGHVQCN
jgi:hypothetical protein